MLTPEELCKILDEPEERQLVWDIFKDYYIKHTILSKMDLMMGATTSAKHKWNIEHAEWAANAFKKLGFRVDNL